MKNLSVPVLFLLQTLIMVVLPYMVWRLPMVRRLVPLVVLQILLGILLGPSVLGHLNPELWSLLFTGEPLQALRGMGLLAVVLFTFLSGLRLQPDEIRSLGRSFVVISSVGMVISTVVGALAGGWIAHHYPATIGPYSTPLRFALVIGLSSAVTALPVLAAILRENGLLEVRLGHLALGSAAANDAILWLVMAFLLMGFGDATVQSNTWLMPVWGMAYLLCMFFPVRLTLQRRLGNGDAFEEQGLVVVCAVIFGSALWAEWIGLHATLGGFVAGIIMPRSVARDVIDRLEPLTVVVLLPFFFTLTGLGVSFAFEASSILVITAVATAASMLGKIGGAVLPARLMGESWATASALGALMQTKGMMEVVVLTIFLDEGLISSLCFSAMIIMALITTAATTPLLRLTRRLTPD